MANHEIAEQLKEAFALFDRNGDGTISAEELKEVMNSITLEPTEAELFKMIETVDANFDDKIDLPEFLTLMITRVNHIDKELFPETYNKHDTDGNGWISVEELINYIKKTLGWLVTQEEAEKVLEAVDINKNGQISYEEFVKCYVLDALMLLKEKSTPLSNHQAAVKLTELKLAFKLYDHDEDGTITSEELKEVMNSVSLKPTENELAAMIEAVDADHDGKIDLAEFLTMMAVSMKRKDSKKLLIITFSEYDTDNDGWISAEELKEGMKNILGWDIDHHEAEQVLKAIDTDQNGQIDYNEFVKMYVNDALLDLIKNQKIANRLTSEQVVEFKEAFDMYDHDRDGFISTEELKSVMSSMKLYPTEVQLKGMIWAVDTNKDGQIDFEEFLAMMTKRMLDLESKEFLRKAFKEYDTDGKGMITWEDLQFELSRLLGRSYGDPFMITEEQAKELIWAVDIDGNNMIDYEEFVKMYVNDALIDLIFGPL